MTTDADGWIEHDGKGMPVPVDGRTKVAVRYKDGIEVDGPAGHWVGWEWSEEPDFKYHITRYRIVGEAKPAATEPVMTLLDELALRILSSLNATYGATDSEEGHAKRAAASYGQARAMMAERSKK